MLTNNTHIWATSKPREYTKKQLHTPKVPVWCGFISLFIIGHVFFETRERDALSTFTFMQDGAPCRSASPDNAFLIFIRLGKTKLLALVAGSHGLIDPQIYHRQISGYGDILNPGISNRSIQFVGRERCDTSRGVKCDAPAMRFPQWWWMARWNVYSCNKWFVGFLFVICVTFLWLVCVSATYRLCFELFFFLS